MVLYINDVTVLEGGGGQGFWDNSTKALVITSMALRRGGSTIVQNYVTSFMASPKLKQSLSLFYRKETKL